MKRASLILFFMLLYTGGFGRVVSSEDSLFLKIRDLSGKYLNYCDSFEKDSVLALCRRAEKQADRRGDHLNKFLALQLSVNVFCQQGNIGLGVDAAKRMYDEAKGLDDPTAKALAVQAIGVTYLYAGRYHEACATLREAEESMRAAGPFLRLRLALQQAQVCMAMDSLPQMADYLEEARNLLPELSPGEQSDCLFYLNNYDAIYWIRVNQPDRARESMEKAQNFGEAEKISDRWSYYIRSEYYDMVGDSLRALAYCDSTLSIILNSGNMNEYKNSLYGKVALLEKMGRDQDACIIYVKIRRLSDSLNISRYAEQINTLHTAYWVDQMAIENIAAHNDMLASAILYATICLVAVAVLIFLSKRKNRQLVLSQKRLVAAREAAADSIHSKSVFLSNMSHELRTPLNAIVGFSGILTGEEDIDSETKQLCGDNIRQNSELLMKLVDDIIGLSELKGDKIKFTVERCDVITLCRHVIKTVDSIKQTPARLHFSTLLETLRLDTDKGRLQQVLINLLVNATKFTKEGDITLTLAVDPERDEAVFTVEDTGCGIPLEKQKHIFERFEKLHENIQGTGLGLSICQLIVEQMGGRIWIDSEYTKGARFVFTHPLHNPSQKQPT